MSTKKIAILAVTILMLSLLAVVPALAVHDLGLFELDRNALDDSGPPLPDDWSTLYANGENNGGSAEAFTGILEDISEPGDQFQGGGSKDNNDITDWLWKPGEPLDKDDITNAYAAGYIYQGPEVCPSGVASGDPLCTEPGDLIIYFGLDRYANNGDAQVGFWFFQNAVGLTNTSSKGGYLFSGTHTVGDLLVQSNFSRGGVISSISVYEWVGSGGSEGTLDLVYTAQDCVDGANPGDLACATANEGDTNSPWPYTPKSGTDMVFPQSSFFEGGINVSALVPEAGCFSGFMAETRTSTPFDARLKDFDLGSFSLCHIEGTKYLDVNGNGTRDTGEPPLANWEIQLSGAASSTAYTDANGHYSFDNLGNGNYTVTEVCPSATPAWVQTEPGASTTDNCGDEVYNFDISLNNTIGIGDFGNGAPTIEATKACTAVVEVGQQIDYDFDVKNTGNVNLVNVDVSDPTVGFDNSPNLSLGPGNPYHYDVQVDAPSSATTINNTVTATGDFGSSPVFAMVSDSASCSTQVVDARISITPDDTNEVGEDHTFTVYAEKNEGQGAGWEAADDGTIVDVTLTDTYGASSSVSTDTCATGTVNGSCSVTFSSNSAGTTTGHASATIASGGLYLSRATDGLAGNSGDATKIWVDARISITPDGTNGIGEDHTFNVYVEKNEGQGAGWEAADDGTLVDVTLTDSNGASSSVSTDTCSTGTVNGSCSVTFSSNSAGTTTGHASATIASGGLDLLRETDGTAGNSGDATKIWVDARISITPDATNEVGTSHTFNVYVEKNEGQGDGWVAADDGTLVDVTLTDTYGASSSVSDDTCATGTVNGSCSVTFSSNSAGTTTGHASATIASGGLNLSRATDGSAGNSGDATKIWVDARISITPDATNEVGTSHTFNVYVEKNEGQGDGWVAADDGTIVTVDLNDSNGASSIVSTDTCATGTAGGYCSVTFSSNSAGTTTGHASATIASGGLDLLRETDGTAGNSGDATKIWVDARIRITPNGTNGIGEDHTFTVYVEKNEGQGADWVAADDGTIVTVDLTDSNGAASIVSTDTCATGTVSGSCSVTFSSNSAGTTTGHASATIVSGGLDLLRETDGTAGNSGDATKIWVAGSLSWLKQDNFGNPVGGATFEVCRTFDRFGNDISDECVTVLDDSAPDADPDPGEFLLVNLALGTYTIQETVPPAGYSGDTYVETIALTLDVPDQVATHIWINTPNQGCTPGFWQGGAGSIQWDEVNDPDWTGEGTNPYIHTTLFNDYFNVVTDSRLDGYTMYDLVSTGGGPDSAVKAARDMVAAYLNETAFPTGYPATSLADLLTEWYDAVAGGDPTLDTFHNTVSGWNAPEPPGYCPLP